MAIKKYLCKTNCYWNNNYFKEGEIYELDSKSNPSIHLVPLDSSQKKALTKSRDEYKKELADLKKEKNPHAATINKIKKLKQKIEILDKSINEPTDEEEEAEEFIKEGK